MRHRNHSNRLSQKPHIARQMLRNMLTSILLYERIRTTRKRAQVLKPMVDRTINLGRLRKDLAIRKINETISDENACRKILEVFMPRYEGRTSGFVRVTAVGMRKGDGAALVDMVLVEGKNAAPVVSDASAAKAAKPKAAKIAKKTADSSAQ